MTSREKESIKRAQRSMTYNQITSCPDMEPEFLRIYEACRDFTMTSLERMYALYQAIVYLEDARIPGDIVECGVWRGGSMMASAMTLRHLNADSRTLHLFDTFEGMVDPGERDIDFSGRHASSRLTDESPTFDQLGRVSIEEVKANMTSTGYPEALVCYAKGRVEDTVPSQAPNSIALLRLDTDWYASTRHEMIHLFPRIARGGVLLVDDYGHWRGAREAVDEAMQACKHPMLLSRIDYTGRIGVKL